MFNNRREVWWGLAGVAGALAIFFFFAWLGWPGAPDSCTRDHPNTCWCEDFLRAGAWIKQPINTWGNLGFFAIGLAVLWQVGSDRRHPPARRNPMTTASPFALVYGGAVLFLGAGSMFFHASMTQWGGWIDTYSLIVFGSFGLLY
ncbi:MAG TPA: hypothetical protein VKY74_21415, partial [Chloroflexia bacterium]|nr:hypothetical protein [Chloroflexia bacterium]